METNAWEDAEERVEDLVVDGRDSTEIARDIISVLAEYGISAQLVETCAPTTAGFGALSGLGAAMTDLRCQEHLFSFAECLIANAGSKLSAAILVAFLEPFLREPFDISDEGFKRYMKWFLNLRRTPALKWAVDESYKMHGSDRLSRDVALVEN